LSSAGGGARGGRASRSERDTGGNRATFPRTYRLTRRSQFRTVYERGKRIGSPSFTLFGLPNDAGSCRLGITATRRLGGAVRRNRIKRVLRDIFRRNRPEIDAALDLVINPRPGIEARDRETLEREFLASVSALCRRFR
jgi:ribonuclease P protein component